jgi:hypothetical protein
MISCYVGGMVQLGIALWAVGDCITFVFEGLIVGTVWQVANRQTWES